jgi:putative ABC transport system substrate-binding protein
MLNIFQLVRLSLLIISLIACNANASSPKIVAITQIIAHESLDKVRDGIIDQLKERYHNDIKLILSDAGGNMVTATQIAGNLVASKPDLIIAISTPSAQSVVKAASKSNIPILFATVTDPIGAKLVEDLKKPGKNVSGTRNLSPVEKQILLIKQTIPSIKKLGVLYSLSEANSVYMLNLTKEIAKAYDIEIIEKAINNSNDVKQASESLFSQIDALFLLQDNIVASSLPLVIKIANQAGKPIFSSYIEAVKQGALAGLAYDEYYIGKQTGDMAIKVLQGISCTELAVEDPAKVELAFNRQTATKLGIVIPKELIKQSDRLF